VKASDTREARVPVAATSAESELSEMNQKEQEHELNEAVKLEGNGVLLGKQSSEESAMVVDSSIPSSHTAVTEES